MKWDDDSERFFDWEKTPMVERDDDLRWFMFVMLLAVLTLTVVFLTVT